MTLHERIAAAIGWSVRDVQSFSLAALREMLRVVGGNTKLMAACDRQIRSGAIIKGG